LIVPAETKINMDKLATSMWLALRAIGFADVRYGIPASSVGFRPSAGPGMTY
jgi:hypothetical protein